ncbi:MAG: repeat protein [Planctomycetota bacterium]|nr:repeat protein [Planctomycetota bacterium]
MDSAALRPAVSREVKDHMPHVRNVVLATLAVALGANLAGVQAQDQSYKAEVVGATEEPMKAIKSLRALPGFKVDLFAAEPMLANPVAFHIDEKGRFYVVETFRLHSGVTDARNHMNWLDDDLKSRTVADRLAMYKQYLSPKEFESYGKDHDRIRLIEDRDGDGKADHATVFADGFNAPEDGLGSGVLTRNGNVYFTCIPDLWLLRDTNGDGKADEKKSLHKGYGVHVGFLGHDLHGLIFGPDGKLYFSIGDRGFNVKTIDGMELANLDSGSVLRCDPDGRNLEVVATGLRNPQELAFTETGDLFTVDNNSDGGDKARLVQILEGGDSGWRIGYQFIESPNSRGIWNSEKMWHPAWDGQAAYILPPLANFTDGPSGLTYYPGTGLNASQKGRFYISDFRGAPSSSGIRSFKLKPKGASFELVEPEEFLWGLEATDCDFGPDGALYVSDWVQGWNKTGKGRIWKVTDPSAGKDPVVAETKKLLAEGFDKQPIDALMTLLGHADQRVRLGAQFELAQRATPIRKSDHSELLRANTALIRAAEGKVNRLARFHGIWGLGQVFRQAPAGAITGHFRPLAALLVDKDDEVRAQSAKLAGEIGNSAHVPELAPLLKDPSPRVRFFTAMSLGRLGSNDSIEPIAAMLRSDDGRDPTLRHAAVMAFSRIWKQSSSAPALILALSEDASPQVRMGVLLTMRRMRDTGASRFLHDSDPAVVLEAARVVTEMPSQEGNLAKLATMASKPLVSVPLARRVMSACEGSNDARGLAIIASRSELPQEIRVEALDLLAHWSRPSHRHPITGLWRPAPERSAEPAIAAFLPVLPKLVSDSPDVVRKAAAQVVAALKVEAAGPTLRGLVTDASKPAESRVEALRALAALKDAKLAEIVSSAIKDTAPSVRVEAVRVLAKTNPDLAIDTIHGVLDTGSILEKQGSFQTLTSLPGPKADAIIAHWLDRLTSGEVAPEIRLDLTEAAARRNRGDVKAKLDRYESDRPKDDLLAAYRDALVGGDAARGKHIFRDKAEVQCLRCHKVDGDGGEVGPELTGIIAKKDRAYILESILLPNKQIAQGFETQLIARNDGQVVAGIVKSEDDKVVRLMTAEGKLVTIPKDQIEEKSRGNSAMPEDVIKNLSKLELRDVIEFLATTKGANVGK